MGCLKLTYNNQTLTRVRGGKASREENVEWVWLSVDPLYFKAPNWTPYRYAFNNPVNIIDPDGLFETEADAKEWAKSEGIRTGWFSRHKVEQESDGTFAINNRKEGSSYSRLSTEGLEGNTLGEKGDGVIKSTLVTAEPYNEAKAIASETWSLSSNMASNMSRGFVNTVAIPVGGVTTPIAAQIHNSIYDNYEDRWSAQPWYFGDNWNPERLPEGSEGNKMVLSATLGLLLMRAPAAEGAAAIEKLSWWGVRQGTRKGVDKSIDKIK